MASRPVNPIAALNLNGPPIGTGAAGRDANILTKRLPAEYVTATRLFAEAHIYR